MGLTVLLNIPHHLLCKARHLYCLDQDEEQGRPTNPEKPTKKANQHYTEWEITTLLVLVNWALVLEG